MYYNPHNGGYVCHRAKCGTKGFTKPGAGAEIKKKSSMYDRVAKLAMIPATSEHMPEEYLKWFVNPVWYVPEFDRVAFEVHNAQGFVTGWVLRAYDGRSPKAFTATDGCALHFTQAALQSRSVAVVEDIPSAEKLSHVFPAVALCGADPSRAQIDQLHYSGVRDIVFALDADATAKAVRLAKRYALEFNTSVKVLQKDPKDSTIQELQEIFNE